MRRPDPSEYAERYTRYVDLVPESDLATALEERIMGYRLLCVARGDTAAPFPIADESAYVRAAASQRCPVPALCEELSLVRQSHVLFVRHLPDEAWDRMGSIAGFTVSARALGYLLLGHERHHWAILRARYSLTA